MSVDLISGSVSALKPEALSVGSTPDMLVAAASPLAKDQMPGKVELSMVADLQANDKVSIDNKPLTVAKAENNSKPAGVVSHVVESYNLKGEPRTKFLDSRNNVVYQVPSEMMAKIQDLMMASNTSADLKA